MGINLLENWQSYRPDKVQENPKVTKQYNTLKNIWMESYQGYIAEALYREGTYSASGWHDGILQQTGSRFLEKQLNMDFYQILHYYYDDSSFSNGGAIRFFDQNKNVISK